MVTAPRTEATGTALDMLFALDDFARSNIEGDYRLTWEGDTVTLDAFDMDSETRYTVTYDESDNRATFGYQDFDVDAYQRPEGYQPNSLPDDNPFW